VVAIGINSGQTAPSGMTVSAAFDPKATSASPNDNAIIAVFRITRWREGNPYGVITLAEINQPGVSRRASERKQETIWRA
jgi:hypothetical protein